VPNVDLRDTINQEVRIMSHPKPLVRLPLVMTCALAIAACSASDRLVEPPPAVTVQRSVVTRRGIDGLKQDIDSAHSLPHDVTMSTARGANISRDELASGLEAVLPVLSRTMSAPARNGAPAPTSPSFDYISYGDVGGTLVLMARAPSNGWRLYDAFAYTSCTQGSMVVASVKGGMREFDFATGMPISTTTLREESSPNYISTWVSVMIRYPSRIGVQGNSIHTCQVGQWNDWPYVPRSAFIVT
jgi:hypothetical protein